MNSESEKPLTTNINEQTMGVFINPELILMAEDIACKSRNSLSLQAAIKESLRYTHVLIKEIDNGAIIKVHQGTRTFPLSSVPHSRYELHKAGAFQNIQRKIVNFTPEMILIAEEIATRVGEEPDLLEATLLSLKFCEIAFDQIEDGAKIVSHRANGTYENFTPDF